MNKNGKDRIGWQFMSVLVRGMTINF